MKRRTVVAGGLALAAARSVGAQTAPPPAEAAGGPPIDAWPRAAFEATTVVDVQARLAIPKPAPGDAVRLEVPDISPVAQPIAVVIETSMPKVDRVALLADRLPNPLIAWLQPVPQSFTRVHLTIRLPHTSTVRAFVRSQGQWYAVQREVKLALEPA